MKLYKIILSLLLLYTLCIAKPIPLAIPNDNKTGLKPMEEGIRYLQSINNQIAFVGFVGPARSGKSFSLNMLLNVTNEEGFPVGHTLAPKTKGLYIWDEPFTEYTTKDGKKVTIILLDTEGLGSAPLSYDKAIILFTSLITSHMVYHLSGYPSRDDITRLYSIVNLIQYYQNRNIEAIENPSLSWVIQKMSLQNEYASESNYFLDHVLQERENHLNDLSISIYNETVKTVRESFKGHLSYLIPSALENNTECMFLDLKTHRDILSEEYVNHMNALRNNLMKTIPKRMRHNINEMSGKDFAQIIIELTPIVNEKIDYVGDRVLDSVARSLVATCKIEYVDLINEISYPENEDTLLDTTISIKEAMIEKYKKSMVGNISSRIYDAYQIDLVDFILEREQQLFTMNKIHSERACFIIRETILSDVMIELQTSKMQPRQVSDLVYSALDKMDVLLHGPSRYDCKKNLTSSIRTFANSIDNPDRMGMFIRIGTFMGILLFGVFSASAICAFISSSISASICSMKTAISLIMIFVLLLIIFFLFVLIIAFDFPIKITILYTIFDIVDNISVFIYMYYIYIITCSISFVIFIIYLLQDKHIIWNTQTITTKQELLDHEKSTISISSCQPKKSMSMKTLTQEVTFKIDEMLKHIKKYNTTPEFIFIIDQGNVLNIQKDISYDRQYDIIVTSKSLFALFANIWEKTNPNFKDEQLRVSVQNKLKADMWIISYKTIGLKSTFLNILHKKSVKYISKIKKK